MITLLDFPRPRNPHEEEQSMRVFYSVFDDVVPLWSLDGDETVAIPVTSMAELVGL